MSAIHDLRFPNESGGYRQARDELLRAEMELRRRMEDVAALRRQLPPGGAAKEDYAFDEGGPGGSGGGPGGGGELRKTRLSELFEDGKDTLVVYSFMYPPGGRPCPACTAFLDSLNANAPHLGEAINLAVVAKSPWPRIAKWAASRGWDKLRLLSSTGNGYNVDYHAEAEDGSQWPIVNVFQKTGDGVAHRYCSELFYAPAEEGQHPRHVDSMWPLWNVLDLTPGGRPDNWFPTRSYERSLAECGEA